MGRTKWAVLGLVGAAWLATAGTVRAEDAPISSPARKVATFRWLDQALYLMKMADYLDAYASGEEAAADASERQGGAKGAEAKRLRDQARGKAEGDRANLLSRADALDAQVSVGKVEVSSKRQLASETRKKAKELRDEAVRLARSDVTPSDPCDPPYAWGPDGFKHYKIACL